MPKSVEVTLLVLIGIAAWTRGASGLGHVIGKLWNAKFDKTPAYAPAQSHGDD